VRWLLANFTGLSAAAQLKAQVGAPVLHLVMLLVSHELLDSYSSCILHNRTISEYLCYALGQHG